MAATLYELLTRRLPYAAESPADLILRQFEGPPPSATNARPDIPLALAELLARCFVFESRDRQMTAAQLAEALVPFARSSRSARAPVPPASSAGSASESAREITFRRRKVRDTAGSTVFEMHELVAPGETKLLPTNAAGTPRPRAIGAAMSQANWTVLQRTAAFALVALVAVAITAVACWSRAPEPRSEAASSPPAPLEPPTLMAIVPREIDLPAIEPAAPPLPVPSAPDVPAPSAAPSAVPRRPHAGATRDTSRVASSPPKDPLDIRR
jgi:serine/threonine-protein kinase